jgi:hypothetical protein
MTYPAQYKKDIEPEKRAYNLFINGSPALGKVAEALREQEQMALHWAAFQVMEKCEKPYEIERFIGNYGDKSEMVPAACLHYQLESRDYEKRKTIELCEVCKLANRIRNNEGRDNG